MSKSISSQAGEADQSSELSDGEMAAAAAKSTELDLQAESLIKTYMMGAGAASLTPVPLIDLAAITAVQMRMIQKLAEHYGKSYSESPVRNTIASLGGAAVGQTGGVYLGISLAKAIPGIGWMLGIVSMPVLVGASTYAIGHVFAQHFKKGGSVFDIGVEDVRGYYKEQVEKGKEIAKSLKRDIHTLTASKEQPA